ncbi:phospholipase/carboxylesterase [Enterococcus sp. DIV0724b]|uniref:alpha/beta hydrolase n=1 Tax=Enterococcus sp. DIV0724b TaxID=2774694 RepID=UPI003D2FA746
MKHFFQKGADSKQLIVAFHGTGGNEYQLLTTVAKLFPAASLLSYLGSIGTDKNRRFFPPLENGKLNREAFDQAVSSFLTEDWATVVTHEYEEIIFLGYSNGANFILGLLEQQPTIADTVILLHPSNLIYQYTQASADTKLILTTGAQDTLSIAGDVLKLSYQLETAFTWVKLLLVDGGHQLSPQELDDVQATLAEINDSTPTL